MSNIFDLSNLDRRHSNNNENIIEKGINNSNIVKKKPYSWFIGPLWILISFILILGLLKHEIESTLKRTSPLSSKVNTPIFGL